AKAVHLTEAPLLQAGPMNYKRLCHLCCNVLGIEALGQFASWPAHDWPTFNAQTIQHDLLIKNIVEEALVTTHKIFRVPKPARKSPFQPRRKIISRKYAGCSPPLSGIENELRRPCSSIDFMYFAPIIVKLLLCRFRLLLVIH